MARLDVPPVAPEMLVQKTFEFLLAREQKEAILRHFELTVVAQYFPGYETEIRRELTT